MLLDTEIHANLPMYLRTYVLTYIRMYVAVVTFLLRMYTYIFSYDGLLPYVCTYM